MKGHSYHLEFKDIETNKTYKSDEFATVRNDYQDSFGGTSLRGKNILKFNISKIIYLQQINQMLKLIFKKVRSSK